MPQYIVVSSLAAKPEAASAHREGHFEYVSNLKREGRLEMGCRFTDGNGGFYILNASSMEEADEMARNDPYHSNRIREYVLREFERRL